MCAAWATDLCMQCMANSENLRCFLHLQYINKVYLSLCKNWVRSRLSHATEAAVCQRCSGLNYSTADITVHLFFIANICLACYIVTMICVSSPDSMYKTNTWKVTRVVRTKGFSQVTLGWCLNSISFHLHKRKKCCFHYFKVSKVLVIAGSKLLLQLPEAARAGQTQQMVHFVNCLLNKQAEL